LNQGRPVINALEQEFYLFTSYVFNCIKNIYNRFDQL